MSAGTVISGGFPGRVAQEVIPNPKCNGCMHFDGQGGRTGICTIGLRPWLCGDGGAADIGYAPIARGAGTYLPDMTNHGARAPEVGDQIVSDLYGAGSTRPVQFHQVSLGEEHIHFVKSFVAQHTEMQKSMCRLCKSTSMIGTGPANVGFQVCTCEPIQARDVAKALMPRLSNRERSVVDLEDATTFVYDIAKSGFKKLEKGTFYHTHGKYVVSPAGGGDQHVDFHPRGGGAKTRVGKVGSHKEARRAMEVHSHRFASGTTPQQREAAAVEIAPGWHAMAGDKSERKTGPKVKKSEDGEQTEKGLSWAHDDVGDLRTTTPHGRYLVTHTHNDQPGHDAPHTVKFWHAEHKGKEPSGEGVFSSRKDAKHEVRIHHAGMQMRAKKSLDGDIEKAGAFPRHAMQLPEPQKSRKTVATASEAPQTEKPYQTKFQRPNDSAKPETSKPSSFNIDTSKLRARGEAGAAKLMTNDGPRTEDGHAARVGQAALESRTQRTPPHTPSTLSPNRPGQNRPEITGEHASAPKPTAPAPKHIDMEEGMSEADKRVGPSSPKPAARAPKNIEMPNDYGPRNDRMKKLVDDTYDRYIKQSTPAVPHPRDVSSGKSKSAPTAVPSMSTLPKKEERSPSRTSYKAFDVNDALEEIKALVKAGKSGTATEVRSPTSTKTKTRTATEVRSPTSTSTDAYTQGNVTVTGGAGSGDTHVHLHGHQAKQSRRADKEAHEERSRGAAQRPEKMMHETGASRPGGEAEKSLDVNKALEEIKRALKFPEGSVRRPRRQGPVSKPMRRQVGAMWMKKPSSRSPNNQTDGLSHAAAQKMQQRQDAIDGVKKSFDEDDIEKSIRWSHKKPGTASTSHGKYSIHANADGSHTVGYINKETGKIHSQDYKNHLEALGGVTDHHLRNRKPPKKRVPKPKQPEKPMKHGEGGCPPCP